MPGWRLWQNCHFRHICQICQYRQLLWGPLIALCFALLAIAAKLSFSPYLPNSPVSPTFMGPLIALCFALLAILAKLSFLPYLPNSPLCSLFCHFCCCVHLWTYLFISASSYNAFAIGWLTKHSWHNSFIIWLFVTQKVNRCITYITWHINSSEFFKAKFDLMTSDENYV